MFNNNTYTDLRTAYKNILIPSYVVQPKCHKTKQLVVWLNRLRSAFEIEPSKSYFIFKSFLTRNIEVPLANIHGRNSLSTPRHYFFFDPPFQNLGLKVVPLAEQQNVTTS